MPYRARFLRCNTTQIHYKSLQQKKSLIIQLNTIQQYTTQHNIMQLECAIQCYMYDTMSFKPRQNKIQLIQIQGRWCESGTVGVVTPLQGAALA